MADFKVNIDGVDYIVSGPAGATQADAEAQARKLSAPGLPASTPLRAQLPGLDRIVPQEQALRREAISQTARETGYPEAFAVGAGRTADRLVATGRQVGNMLSRDPEANKRLAEEQKTNTDIYSGLQRELPLTTSIGEAAPYLAVPASAGIVGGAAITGGLEAAQYGTPSERAVGGAVAGGGSLVGGALGRAVGNILRPGIPGFMTETRQAALDAARRIGYQPRLSEITGSPLAARIEDVSARVPGGAGVMQSHDLGNRQAINRAAGRSIGETTDEMGPPVLARAADRLGKVFEDIKTLGPVNVNGRQVLPIQIGNTVGTVSDDIIRQQGKMIPGQRDADLLHLAQQAKALAQNNGRIDGETYQLVRSGLSNASFEATGTNKALYGKLLTALDDSAERSLRQIGRADLADGLRTARPQYTNLKTLEKGTTAEGGNVSPARVASTMRTNNPSAFREGRMGGDLYDVAQIGENLKPLQAGSQTFERQMMSPLTLAAYSPLSWLGAHGTTNPIVNRYAEFAMGSPVMGILGNAALPVGRAGAVGLLGMPGGLLTPVMPK